MTALTAALHAYDRRMRLAERLWLASVALLVALPAVMVLSSRSSPLVLTLSAAAALGAAALEGRLPEAADDARWALRTPLGLAVLAFLGWSAVSLAWSSALPTSLHALGELVLPLVAALALALTLPRRVPRPNLWLLSGGMAVACAIILYELYTGLALRHALGGRAALFIFNRPVLTLLALLFPALWLATLLPRPPSRWLMGASLAGVVAVTILHAESGAAVLGLLAGAVTFAAARVAPKPALALAAAGFVAAFAAAPFLGDAVSRLVPAGVHGQLASANSDSRVGIWRSFGAAVREEPLVGQGFGVSPRFHLDAVTALVPPKHQELLAAGHPHNAALQIWAELGLVGAALGLVVVLLALRGLSGLSAERLAPRLALVGAAAAVSLVGHGAWQGWWPAALGAAVVWFRIADEEAGP